MIVIDETRLRALLQESDRAYAAGDAAVAMQTLVDAQKLAPDHPLILNVAGVRALKAGQGVQAVELFRRALAAEQGSVALWMNMAAALQHTKQDEEEARALDSALTIDPRHLPALLHKGAHAERRGDTRAAARHYTNALKTIPEGTALPEALRPAVARAMEVVRSNAAALGRHFEQRLAAVRADNGSREDRFDHALATLLGKRRIYYPEPTQLHFPKLPALEFHPRTDFPWLAELEAGTDSVRAECERLLATDQDALEPYLAHPDGVPLDQWKELNRSRRWSAAFLWRDGKPVEANIARCPNTAALLSRMPMHDVPGYAPTAFFSILDAKTHIPAHTGVTNSRVIVHLPLVLPGSCRFRVGSETREWRMGEAWVFDDSIEHEAWNDSDVPRAILIFDVWNPNLTATERALVREAMHAFSDFYADVPSQSPST